jgi:cellulose synthase/poly-beta-1,6-N-acetylglucosamine synthase-like glycosyltransferase
MSEKPFISIVIPVKNGERCLSRCLESIKKQSYPQDRFEVIISDGMSMDNTVKIAHDHGARIVKNSKITVGPGRNVGFKAAKGDIIVFSDDDCVMDKDWLSNCIKYFDNEQVGGLSGPTITQNEGGPLGEAIGIIFELAASAGVSAHRGDRSPVEEVQDIPGCNAFYRRDALEKVFPIDESLITAEDVEMNRLIRQAGFKLLYVPDVKLWHYRRQNIYGFFKQIYRFAVGRLQIGRKNINMLKPTHIIVGLSLPIIMLLLLLLFTFHVGKISFYIFFIFLLIVFGSIYGFIKSGSIMTALFMPVVAATMVIAWSLGFIRELISPIAKR